MKITEDIIERYTCGDCWILALALNDLTGWPLMLYGEHGGDWFNWRHAAVRNRPGFIVDVYGEQTDVHAGSFYGAGEWKEYARPVYMSGMVDQPELTDVEYDHATKVAKQLLSNMKVNV